MKRALQFPSRERACCSWGLISEFWQKCTWGKNVKFNVITQRMKRDTRGQEHKMVNGNTGHNQQYIHCTYIKGIIHIPWVYTRTVSAILFFHFFIQHLKGSWFNLLFLRERCDVQWSIFWQKANSYCVIKEQWKV